MEAPGRVAAALSTTMSTVRQEVLANATIDCDELDQWQVGRLSVSGFRMWRNRQTGGCMKLTLLGLVAILGVVALMVFITIHQWDSVVAEK